MGQANGKKKKGFKSWLSRFLGNEGGPDAVDDAAVEDARKALQKDFEPMAADIAAALNEKDPFLRKALLLKIAESDVPASGALTDSLSLAMADEFVGSRFNPSLTPVYANPCNDQGWGRCAWPPWHYNRQILFIRSFF